MRIFENNGTRLFVTSDVFEKHYGNDPEEQCAWLMRRLTGRPLFNELLHLYGSALGMNGYTLLDAHSITNEKEWMVFDGEREYFVQDWVDRRDGITSAIFLCTCNPKGWELDSERSVLIHPYNGNFTPDDFSWDSLRVYMPGVGYVDGRHDLKHAIRRLREEALDTNL